MNKRKVLSVDGKVIQQKENGKKKEANVCLEFGLVNYTIQTIQKNRPKIISMLTKQINHTSIHNFLK